MSEVAAMKSFVSIWMTAMLLLCRFVSLTAAPRTETLRLVQTIPMPNVKGRIDHLDVDVDGKRLFVAGLENGSVEVIDLQAGKWLKSISGFKKTQGIAYVASLNKLFVASGDDGTLRVFRGDTLKLLDAIKLDLGPNRVAYDARAEVLYVGYGGKDAGQDYGQVGIIDAKTDKCLGDVKVEAHPAELLIVMDSRTGKEVANLPTVEGMDGVYFDAAHKLVYVSGGRDYDVGYIFAYHQKDADHYEVVGKISTKSGAGTSFWSPELNRYYVAAPAHENGEAAILVFEPQP